MTSRRQRDALETAKVDPDEFELARQRASLRSRLFGDTTRFRINGRYEVRERIGSGGAGTVYKSYDPELDRDVAIKVVRRDRRDAAARSRLIRESRALAQLSHPNVVAVHDVLVFDDDIGIVMELVRGKSLRDWATERSRSEAEVVGVYLQAGRGLAAAHAEGLVHGDFKPDNAMMGDDGRVRVMDFGLARVATVETMSADEVLDDEPLAGADEIVTQRSFIVGTPAYMAPEQFEGRDLDPRTDQFSFCVALWEQLFGERPFAGSTFEVLAAEVSRGVVRRPPTENRASRWVRPLLERGLSSDPSRRWPDLGSLLDALEEGAARRRRRLSLIAGGGACVIGVAIWGGWTLDREGRRESCRVESEAVYETWNDTAGARLRGAVEGTEAPYASVAFDHAVPYLDVYADAWATRYAQGCMAAEVDGSLDPTLWAASKNCLAERRGELGALLEVLSEASDSAVVQRMVGSVAGLGRVDACADPVSLARRARTSSEGDGRSTDEMRQRLWRADAMISAARYDEADPLVRELVEATSDHPNIRLRSRVLRTAAGLAEEMGDYDTARARMAEAFDIALAAQEDDIAFEAATALVATLGSKLGKHDEAHLWARIAQGLRPRLGNDVVLSEASLHGNLGHVLDGEGRYDEAERAHERALAIYEAVLGPRHPSVGIANHSLGTVYASQSRDADAERAYTAALKVFEQTLGPHHPLVAFCLTNLGTVYRTQGRTREAERAFERGSDLFKTAFGPGHPNVALTRGNLGGLYRDQGRYTEAEQILTQSLEALEAVLGPGHPDTSTLHYVLGDVYDGMGRFEDAEREHLRALAIRQEALELDHPHVAASKKRLAELYAKHDRAKARPVRPKAEQ